jgi:hypothetical protein
LAGTFQQGLIVEAFSTTPNRFKIDNEQYLSPSDRWASVYSAFIPKWEIKALQEGESPILEEICTSGVLLLSHESSYITSLGAFESLS